MKCPKCKTGLLVPERVENLKDEWEYSRFIWQVKCVNCGFRYERFAHENKKKKHTKKHIRYRRYARKFRVHDVEE